MPDNGTIRLILMPPVVIQDNLVQRPFIHITQMRAVVPFYPHQLPMVPMGHGLARTLVGTRPTSNPTVRPIRG